jgi:putative hydrolase of the HAD superfamily
MSDPDTRDPAPDTRPLRAVLFDYGGTLDGAGTHWLDRFVGLYREAGADVPFEALKSAFYEADRAAYAEPRLRSASLAALMEFHVGVQLATLKRDDARLRRFLVERFVASSRAALAESRAVLAELAADYALGVVSNFYGNVERILRDAGIAPLLRVVADSTAVGAAKPDAAIFQHAVARLGTPASETLHVGDSYERDVLGARAAGLRAAWLTGDHAPTAAPDRAAADVRLASLRELRPWLLRG